MSPTRHPVASFLALLVLLGCDEPSTTSPGAQSGLAHPGSLVGSWVSHPSEYSAAHLVLRADGKGHSIGESGSRRDVFALSWSADDSTILLSRPGAPESRTYWTLSHDSLRIISGWGTPWRDTTAIFVRESEPSLVASGGSVEPRVVGSWTGFSPTVSDHYSNDVFVGKDTTWEPESFQFLSNGVGSNVTFREEAVEDSASGDWAYEWVPDDTTNFTWWTGGEFLYFEVWNPMANPPNAKNVIGTQVTRWNFEADSLLITKLWGTPISQRFVRVP